MMKKKYTPIILTLFLCIQCTRNNESIVESNSQVINETIKTIKNKNENVEKRFSLVKLLYEETKSDTLKLFALNYMAHLSPKVSKSDSTKYYLKKLEKEAKQLKNDVYLGKAYFNLGKFYSKKKEDISYRYYKKSLEVYSKIKDSLRISRCYKFMAQRETGFGDYLLARENLSRALIYLSSKNNNEIAQLYYLIGVNYKMSKFYNEAIKRYDVAIQMSTNSEHKVTYFNAKANAYRYLNEHSKSIEIFESLLDTVDYSTRIESKARVIDNLAYSKWIRNSEENVIEGLVEAKNIREKEQDNLGLVASYAHISDFYKEKDDVKSLEFAYKMLEKAEETKNTSDIIEALDKIKLLETPIKALEIANRRSSIKDSIELAKDNQQIKYAFIKYESEEYEKQAAENKLLAEKQKSQKFFWIFMGLGSLFMFVVYTFYRRNKTKKEKIVEVYKTETRIAKRIHDELANDVFTVMNKLQNNPSNSLSLLEDLDKIYQRTRDISHENSPVITGVKFEEFLNQLFLEFSTDTCKILQSGLTTIGINQLNKEKQVVLYRVLQELLINMKKHSKASLVVITFSLKQDKIHVNYKDNGVGIDMLRHKNGLQNMETRIKSIGGTINFDSEKLKGFQSKFQFKR